MNENEQKELLNKLDQGYIGLVKPKVRRTWNYRDMVAPSMFEGSDNMPSDPEQAGYDDIND